MVYVPQAQKRARQLHPKRRGDGSRRARGQRLRLQRLGYIGVLGVVFQLGGLSVYHKAQAVDKAALLGLREQEVAVALALLLAAKCRVVVAVGIGPQVKPENGSAWAEWLV